MSEPTTHASTEPATGGSMPVVTMLGAALSFFLFVGLIYLMFSFNKQFYTPRDEATERKKEIQQQREADRAALQKYDKGATPGTFRMPIDQARQKLIQDRNKPNAEPGK